MSDPTAPPPSAADTPVEIAVALTDRPDGPANTLVVYDWFSHVGTPPRGGHAVEALVDGEAAWGRVHADLLQARRDVRVATWMLRADTELVRPEGAALAPPDQRAAHRFGAVIEHLADRGVAVRVLIWGMTYTPMLDGWLRRWYWQVPPNIDVLEQDHPVLIGSHHQKTITIDGRVGYCGGMNLKENDWDTTGHAVFEPRRMPHDSDPADRRAVAERRAPSKFAPRHDLTLRIEGPTVGDLDDNFTQRWARSVTQWRRRPAGWIGQLWRRVTGKRLPPDLGPPLETSPPAGDAWVQIVRTRPARRGGLFSAPPAEQGILDAYRRAIANARRAIYIENQYFRSPLIGEALAEALARNPRLRLIVVAWPINEGKKSWLDPSGYWTAHTQDLIRAVRPDFTLTRVIAADPDAAGQLSHRPIDVHAKIMIIDDVWLTIGSANINDRGFKYEGEINAVVVDRREAHRLRVALMAEHLGLPVDDPRLLEQDEAFDLWAARAQANPGRLARGEVPEGHVHAFVQQAPARSPFGVGSGVF